MKKLAIMLMTLGVLLACVPTVFANDSDPTTGEITITGSAAHVNTFSFLMAGHNLGHLLNGTDSGDFLQLTSLFVPGGIVGGTYDGWNQSWVMTDPRGTGAGYDIAVKSTDWIAISGPGFVAPGDPANKTIPLVGKDAHYGVNLFTMRMPASSVVWVDGQFSSDCTTPGGCGTTGDDTDADLMPVSEDFIGGWTALTLADKNFAAATAGTGMGTYQFNPEFRLFVPAETYAGVYHTTVTLTLTASAEYIP
jgi:hypothetical protein